MTIFRNIKNGKLYMLYQGMRWKRELEAVPYRHNEQIKRPKMNQFIAVAEC